MKFYSAIIIFFLALVANANLSEVWIEGTIAAFDKVSITVLDNLGNRTLIPRNLAVKDIRSGQKFRILVSEKEFDAIKKLNIKK